MNLLDQASRFRRAIEIQPNSIAAYNDMSLALKDAGQLDEAIGRRGRGERRERRAAVPAFEVFEDGLGENG